MKPFTSRRDCIAWMVGLGTAFAAHGQPVEPPRTSGPIGGPDAQGVARTWSKLPRPALVRELRKGGYVLLFRHGRTDWEARDVLPAQPEDRSKQRNLSAAGREQGQRTGEVFQRLGLRFDKVWASPWFRTRDFAELIAGRPAEVTRKLLAPDEEAGGHRLLVDQMPAPGTNNLIVGHQGAIKELGHLRWNEWEEGSLLVLRPRAGQAPEAVAHLNHADILALGRLAGQAPAASQR